MIKIRFTILFILILFFNGYSQKTCELIKSGISFYQEKQYKHAVKEFKDVYKDSEKGDNCYIESSYWLAKTYLKISAEHPNISIYLGNALSCNDLQSLRFYALEYPKYNPYISDDINNEIFLKENDPGEIYFLLGVIYAKQDKVNEVKLFNYYLKNAIENGFSEDILYSNNYIKEINPEVYNSIVGNLELSLKNYVENKINQWQKKGKFEKTATYIKRVNEESREYKIKELTQYYIDSLGASRIDFKKASNEYDADNEVFKITFNNLNSIYLPVPLNEARIFDQHFEDVEYEDPNFTYFDNKFEILHLEIINPYNKKRYI